MQRFYSILIGYVLGCFQSAERIQRWLRLQGDIREQGTGIPGTANMIQTYGAKAGILTFLTDALKAGLAAWLCKGIFPMLSGDTAIAYAGAGVISGHCWPAHRKFRGGRGIACQYGLAMVFGWEHFLILTAGEVFGLILSRLMIGGAIGAAIMFFAAAWILPYGWEVRLMCGVIWGIIMIRHIEKFKSIAKGQEPRFSFAKFPSMLRGGKQ